MATPWYATRESVRRALDQAESARANAEIDDALQTATDDVFSLLHRYFYPRVVSVKKPWPDINQQGLDSLWLDPTEELISVTTLTSGGVVVPAGNYYLEPVNQGPPFDQIQINRNSNSSLASSGSGQRSIQIDGVAGYTNVTRASGALSADLNNSATTANISDSAAVGVGDLLTIGTEWLIVTEKSMLTTGQTLQTPLTASKASTLVAVTTGSAYHVGETILLDAERMTITDIAGNNLVVVRGVDGTVVAAHAGSTIFAPRTIAVERAALGSTAASHTNGDPVLRQVWPSLVTQYCRASAINNLLQSRSGWARTVGSGDNMRESSGRGITDLRKRVVAAHGIQQRVGTI